MAVPGKKNRNHAHVGIRIFKFGIKSLWFKSGWQFDLKFLALQRFERKDYMTSLNDFFPY